jgi:hypothetical protein
MLRVAAIENPDCKEKMRSNLEQLGNRGFVTDNKLSGYKSASNDKLIKLLTTQIATERTIAAKIIGQRKIPDSLPLLCDSLKAEKKLYTKIAICEAIEKFRISALKYLIPLIGKIGNNQHRKIDLIDIKKKSYPLPRDIVIRIIIRIGSEALPVLEDLSQNGTYEQKVEVVDGIGHIVINYNDHRSENVLLNEYAKSNDELLKWKLIRTFQSFNSKEIRKILKEERNSDNMIFREEAKRSLLRIKERQKFYCRKIVVKE